jgi:hypothetical protein
VATPGRPRRTARTRNDDDAPRRAPPTIPLAPAPVLTATRLHRVFIASKTKKNKKTKKHIIFSAPTLQTTRHKNDVRFKQTSAR